MAYHNEIVEKQNQREKSENLLGNKKHITFKGATWGMPSDYGHQKKKWNDIIKERKRGKVPANLEIYPKQNYPSKMNIKWRCFRQAEAKEFIANRPVL